MVTNKELERRLNNLINIGTVYSISKNKKLAAVDILGRKTTFFPIMGDANTFKRKASPVRIGEQVAVFCPFGNSDFGFIVAGMFNTDCKEPDGFNENIEISEYEDGTIISYDVVAKELKVDAINQITIICQSANIKANSIGIKANSVDFLGGTIKHDGVDISKTHTHGQNSGDHFGGGATTTSPNN